MNASSTSRSAIPRPCEPALIQSVWFLLDPVGYAARVRARFGHLVKLTLIGTGEVVYVTRPDLVQRVLTDRKTFENYSGDEILAPLIGQRGVIMLTADTHLRRRKLLLPAFHGERLARWSEVIAEVARREIGALPRDVPIAVRPAMQRITVEVICRVVFGVQDPGQLNRLHEAIASWSSRRLALPLMFPRLRVDLGPRSPWGGLNRAKAAMHALIDEAIAGARASDPESRDDVLSILVSARDEDGNSRYTDADLRDELLGLLFAGQDTTASALAWSCVLLSDNPAAWRRLVAEAQDGGTEWADAIGKETLRLRPSVAGAGRYATIDTELDGTPIPAGTRLVTLTLSAHDADSFPRPSEFLPERWLTEEQPWNYASTPFGGGVHRCVGASLAGLEMRIVLHELARAAAELRPARGRRDRHQSHSVVLVPSRGGRVIIRRHARASYRRRPGRRKAVSRHTNAESRLPERTAGILGGAFERQATTRPDSSDDKTLQHPVRRPPQSRNPRKSEARRQRRS